MPRYAHGKPPTPKTKPSACLLKALKTELEDNIKIRRSAASKFRDDIRTLVYNYMSFCEQLRCQQSKLISEAFSHGFPADDILRNRERYEISDGSRFMADNGNVIISYWPKSALVEDFSRKENDKELQKEIALHKPFSHMHCTEDILEPMKEPPPGVEERSLRPRKRRPLANSKRKQDCTPRSTQPQIPSTKRRTVILSEITGCKDTLIADFPPESIEEWSRPLNLTRQPFIKNREVRKRPSWVFSYTLDRKTAFYTIRCPAECPSPVFSAHPLYESRAQGHLKNCKIDFEGEEDMVRKYARQVVCSRKNELVTCKWVKWHNGTLLGKSETKAHSENIQEK